MIDDFLSWETEPSIQADGWPTGDGGDRARALAPTEPDFDTGLCVGGVVAGTAELKDAVFTHTVLGQGLGRCGGVEVWRCGG